MHAFVLAGILALGLVGGGDKSADVSKKLVGTWQLTKGTVGGNPFPEQTVKKLKLEITQGKYKLTGAESPDEGTWTLHADTKPMGLDVMGTEGPNKGRTYQTIFELKGDTLKVCYDLSGKTRPAKFESQPKTLLFLAEYKREKK